MSESNKNKNEICNEKNKKQMKTKCLFKKNEKK